MENMPSEKKNEGLAVDKYGKREMVELREERKKQGDTNKTERDRKN